MNPLYKVATLVFKGSASVLPLEVWRAKILSLSQPQAFKVEPGRASSFSKFFPQKKARLTISIIRFSQI